MGFVTESWKRKRNVIRLEKEICNKSIHSNKLMKKITRFRCCGFFIITEIKFKLAVELVQR